MPPPLVIYKDRKEEPKILVEGAPAKKAYGKPGEGERDCECPNCRCVFRYTDDHITMVMDYARYERGVMCPWCESPYILDQ